MKMKMFIHNQPDEAEKAVNQWLSEEEVVVHHITQSQCERQGRFVLILSVFYQQKEADNEWMEADNQTSQVFRPVRSSRPF